MTNYDMDEIERKMGKRSSRGIKSDWPKSIELGKDEMPHTAIDVEIPDEDFIKLAHAAHTRDITVNKMVNILLRSSMKDLDYRYEHNNKPQLLNEDNW